MAGRNLFLRSFENKWPVSDKLLELRNRPLVPVERKLIRLILLFFYGHENETSKGCMSMNMVR